MSITRPAIWLLGCIGCVMGCGPRETLPPLDLVQTATEQYGYFPLRVGHYNVYRIDSTIYDFAGGATAISVASLFAKEVVADTFRDLTGVLTYTIERYERLQPDHPWVLRSVGTAQRTADQAIRTENNLRFLKLVFPMTRRSEWDGNLWIDPDREIAIADERMRPFANWRYEVDSIDVRAKAGSFTFDSTLLLTEVNEQSVVEWRKSRVRYAKNIGVVWREQYILDSQYCNKVPPPADCATKPWLEKAERGYILRQTLIAYQ